MHLRHAYAPFAVQHAEYVVIGGPGTLVISRCTRTARCTRMRMQTIKGTWSLHQVTQGDR